jgi:alkanesulfonate monooxygenase SsuD/methylene tetrahydromethanopterin reductase-like flavin-dependent oxidoreductase (luciferase family)
MEGARLGTVGVMRRDVTFGLWYDFRNPLQWRESSFTAFYAQTLEQIAWAESLGYGSVWLTEHHFCDDGYSPSPFVLAGAIGARTTTMRIGTNLILLPLADPVRVAEDAATVSLLTGGRFDLGVGLGYRQLEFDAFHRSIRNRPSLMEEGVAIIRAAWSGQPLDFRGRCYTYPDIAVQPVPENPPALYMGGLSEPAIARAAAIADGFLSTGGIGHEVYLAALAGQGKSPSDGIICAGHWAIIDEDPERARRDVAPHALYQSNQYIAWGVFGPPDQVPQFPDGDTALDQGLYQVWDGDTAVAELTSLLKTYPQIRDVHFWAVFPGEPLAQGARRIEYMATKVLPRVRQNLGD